MIRALKQLIGDPDRPDQFYECRQCGTSVSKEADDCPECGSDDVVRYDL